MSFNLDEFTQIVSTIDELLYMRESEPIINIFIGYEDAACTEVFRKLCFALKNSKAEIKIYDYYGIFSYLDLNGQTLKSIRFTDNIDSYRQALKKIVAFDRQYISHSPIILTPIDRASFGLIEPN